MEIQRTQYIDLLLNRMHNKMIKVITGMRRSGKSYLLFNLFKKTLIAQGVAQSHIISIELDRYENRAFRDPDVVLEYIHSCIKEEGMYYLLMDEVQMLSDFEEVLNSLMHNDSLDIYVTGSNSKFLSKDVMTQFRGRGDEIHVFPLTFKEFMQVYEGDVYHGWSEYVVYGGLPLVATMRTDEQKIHYLTNLFTETYLKDIIERYHIDKIQEMDDLLNVLASSVGSLTNPPKIEATFKKSGGNSRLLVAEMKARL